jgi:hypothetical protein
VDANRQNGQRATQTNLWPEGANESLLVEFA